jgi:hypothetical protein
MSAFFMPMIVRGGRVGAVHGVFGTCKRSRAGPAGGRPVRLRGAAATVTGLGLVLVVALLMLIPAQPSWTLGLEVLLGAALALPIQLQVIVAARRDLAEHPGESHRALRVMAGLIVASYAPIAVAIVLLLLGSVAALYVLAAAVIATMLVVLVGAWVMLVEVLR